VVCLGGIDPKGGLALWAAGGVGWGSAPSAASGGGRERWRPGGQSGDESGAGRREIRSAWSPAATLVRADRARPPPAGGSLVRADRARPPPAGGSLVPDGAPAG
jgi:hypothetical protein